MRSFVSTVVLLLTTTASASSLTKRGYSDVVWQGAGPQPFKTLEFDARSPTVHNGSWFRYKTGGVGVGVTPGNQVAWRLTDEPTSEVVFSMPEDRALLAANYNGSTANEPAGVQHFATVGAADFSAPSNATVSARGVEKRNIWNNSTGGTPVPFTITITVDNGCSNGRTLLVSAVDATGAVTNLTAVDYIGNTDLSGVLPMNVTVSLQDSPADVTTVSYFAPGALTYKVGSAANQPTVPPANIYTSIFWCDAD
ncbi:hypothetical protein C8R44DRAFT_187630 [Mycena epipterygia]|nr:hypothetical protein C8R44DRAFT_187630 [Mycena epipterygia]